MAAVDEDAAAAVDEDAAPEVPTRAAAAPSAGGLDGTHRWVLRGGMPPWSAVTDGAHRRTPAAPNGPPLPPESSECPRQTAAGATRCGQQEGVQTPAQEEARRREE